MHTVERFIILLYDRTITCTDIDKSHENVCKEAKCKANPIYQGSSGTACEESDLPRRSHTWPVIASRYRIAFANLDEASKACCELVSCKRKNGCVKGCKCKKAALQLNAQHYMHVKQNAVHKIDTLCTVQLSSLLCVINCKQPHSDDIIMMS